ncbi:hypothetical protein PENARI_c016G12558 [Penicillium arizonense]|uniref:Uncharacterized protein n=1 Tax=Penicillium arizonense TaxID=1835702 RepID=A0A1F5LBD1_PENAI|nr:hypothetical protein PENARI_c016G12558 [Penicillium arizonense]OGE50514.1 hypothetical protein PENARI_c016G12558 [Penicillium arizonense]
MVTENANSPYPPPAEFDLPGRRRHQERRLALRALRITRRTRVRALLSHEHTLLTMNTHGRLLHNI